MNGSHSTTSRDTRRRRSATENAAIPTANHANTRSCDVGTPTVNTMTTDAAIHVTGIQNRTLTASSSHYSCGMVATSEIEVRSPFSGDVVGTVPKHDADDARRALDAAERALREPLPA